MNKKKSFSAFRNFSERNKDFANVSFDKNLEDSGFSIFSCGRRQAWLGIRVAREIHHQNLSREVAELIIRMSSTQGKKRRREDGGGSSHKKTQSKGKDGGSGAGSKPGLKHKKRKKERQVKKKGGELLIETKRLWEAIRRKDITKKERSAQVTALLKLCRGQMLEVRKFSICADFADFLQIYAIFFVLYQLLASVRALLFLLFLILVPFDIDLFAHRLFASTTARE
jgi:hypothetical protein